MSSSVNDLQAQAIDVSVTDIEISVDLTDGRTIIVPVGWYPRLQRGTAKERKKWRFVGQGEGIHWPDLDEDVRVQNLLAGKPSGESQRSLKRWLESRAGRGKKKQTRPP